jgi:beta-lactamase regulating signal transducer with metallopeptidase domain
MTPVFLKLLNMSIAASWLVLAVIALRFLLKKAPSWISCLLWGIVALRLVMPFTIESALSLIPSGEVIPLNIASSQVPAIYSGIPAVNSAVNPVVTQHFAAKTGSLETLLGYGACLWLAGVALMLIYSGITYWKLRRQVAVSIPVEENVCLCDLVDSPFLLGIFRPKIYLPSDLPDEQQYYVLAHENAHLMRRDHLWKPLGFLLLTLYWFNPLMWAAYILLCRDIERACDEKVISRMDPAGKLGYSAALVACSVHRRMVMACPVAFGEVSVKSRVKGVLHYKKPVFRVVCLSILACLITAVCFLTNPQVCAHAYEGSITTEPTCTHTGMQTQVCSLCQHSYTSLVDPVSHTYDSGTVTEEPTCTHEGRMVYSCVDCGHQQEQSVEKIAHQASETQFVQEANCSQEGSVSSLCSLCGVEFVTQILPVNDVHGLQETVLKEASCHQIGEGKITCSRCDYSESCTYAQTPHNYLIESSQSSTCNRPGWTLFICVDCGSQSMLQYGVTNHSWQYYSSTKKICSYCGWIVPSGGRTLF